jgi:hypothetical protein
LNRVSRRLFTKEVFLKSKYKVLNKRAAKKISALIQEGTDLILWLQQNIS